MKMPRAPALDPAARPAARPASRPATVSHIWRAVSLVCSTRDTVTLCVAPGYAPDATSRVPPLPQRGNEKSPLESGGERAGALFSIATGVASPSCPRLHPLAQKTWASGFRAFGLAPVVTACAATTPFSRLRSKAKGVVAAASPPTTGGRAAPPNVRPSPALGRGRSSEKMGDEAAHFLDDAGRTLAPPGAHAALGRASCAGTHTRGRWSGPPVHVPRPRPALNSGRAKVRIAEVRSREKQDQKPADPARVSRPERGPNP